MFPTPELGGQPPDRFKPAGIRLLRVIALNTLIGLAIAVLLSWLGSQHGQNILAFEIKTSLIHSTIYGLAFGLTAPRLAERVESATSAWTWIVALLLVVLIALLSTLVVQASLFTAGFEGREAFRSELLYKSASVSIIAVVIGLGVYMYESVRTRMQDAKLHLRTQELERERTVKLLAEARLASLESRLHPHFLFNTLNSISALILEDPAIADEMVQRLARLLRASLDACEQNRVSLEEELNLAIDYLTIEQARFRERLSYAVDVAPELKFLEVPPIVLQPLIENSVKFAVAPRVAGGSIRISASHHAGRLELEVWDNGPGFTADMMRPGHGLDTLQERLTVMFGENSHLQVSSKAGGTAVRLQLPANRAVISRIR